MPMLTIYPWHTGRLSRPVRLLMVSDLHNALWEGLLPLLGQADALLVAGDYTDRYHQQFDQGLAFIREASGRLPTFVGVGNHEMRLRDYTRLEEAIRATDATFLFNRCAQWGELTIGCWYHPERYGHADMMPQLEAGAGARILLCHKPEDYLHHLQGAQVDLALAGHAHGGQVRFAGKGLYAPGQGILPRYTRGVEAGRLIISAGASNPVRAPRWGNPCEVLRIDLD